MRGPSELGPRTLDDRGISVVCALIALAVSGMAVIALLSAPGANLTSLIRMEEREPIAAIAKELEPDFSFVRAAHYDGVYYWAIAIDPLATGQPSEVIDLAAHRYGHPGYGWLAWVASLGNPRWTPQALLGLSLLGMAAATYLTARTATHLGLTAWGGLTVALNPGLVLAVTTNTSEAVTAALLAAGLFLWFTGRRLPSAAVIAFLCFFKFQMLLIPAALGLWEIISLARQGKSNPRELGPSLTLLAAGPVAFLGWTVYLTIRFGELPFSGADSFLSPPFTGFLTSIRDISNIQQMDFQSAQLASLQVPLLACVMVITTIAVIISARFKHPMDSIFLLQGGFLLLLNWWTLIWPKDMIRMLAIPIPLFFAVLHLRRLGQEGGDVSLLSGVAGPAP